MSELGSKLEACDVGLCSVETEKEDVASRMEEIKVSLIFLTLFLSLSLTLFDKTTLLKCTYPPTCIYICIPPEAAPFSFGK